MEVCGQAGRHREVQLAEELIAVFAVEFQGEGAVSTGRRGRGARFQARVEWANLTGALTAVRTRFQTEDLVRLLVGNCFIPGKEVGIDRVNRACSRGRHQASFCGK